MLAWLSKQGFQFITD